MCWWLALARTRFPCPVAVPWGTRTGVMVVLKCGRGSLLRGLGGTSLLCVSVP